MWINGVVEAYSAMQQRQSTQNDGCNFQISFMCIFSSESSSRLEAAPELLILSECSLLSLRHSFGRVVGWLLSRRPAESSVDEIKGSLSASLSDLLDRRLGCELVDRSLIAGSS